MVKRWLSIIGIGEDGLEGLTPNARNLISKANILIGGQRHLAMVPINGQERWTWPSPIRTLIKEIEAVKGRRVCVLTSGDPMHFGIGTSLVRCIPISEITIIPGQSAFTMASSRLGWTRHDTDCLSLHGRPLELLHPYILPSARLIVLTEDGEAPSKIANLLFTRGYGKSHVVVFERMGGSKEKRIDSTAESWNIQCTDKLNTVAVECKTNIASAILSRSPGLPDEAFYNDGQLTKQEVRAITISALTPTPGATLWDIGAGSGSVAIEWMRQHPKNGAIAIESNVNHIQNITRNANALGTPLLKTVLGTAPKALKDLPEPDAIFVGGGITSDGLLDYCWRSLRPGGRLVANVVTIEGELSLTNWHKDRGGKLRRIAIERAGQIGKLTGWRPAMTVTQYIGHK